MKLSIISDRAALEREYPCLAAVDRAARGIERHAARVIWLEYEGEGAAEETLFIVGKGQRGSSRDAKCETNTLTP